MNNSPTVSMLPLPQQGCTVLLVIYDNQILDIADRIVYMKDGRLKTNTVTAAIAK
ncbi:hypothetical protein [Trichocoleus desertorum]|uniref:hypothetical protein n=1 Tax=Trichocoleus desertorum TaxID=1481672 RepID=UPI003D651379